MSKFLRAAVSVFLDQRLKWKRYALHSSPTQTEGWGSRLDPTALEQRGRERTKILGVWLMERLATFPYWERGHAQLARLALELDDIRRVYASGLALQQLNPDSTDGALFIAISYLRRGSSDEAARLLEGLLQKAPDLIEAREELAAAYLVLGREGEIESLLGAIPNQHLSNDGRAALSYAREKAKEQSDGESSS